MVRATKTRLCGSSAELRVLGEALDCPSPAATSNLFGICFDFRVFLFFEGRGVWVGGIGQQKNIFIFLLLSPFWDIDLALQVV